MEVIVSRLKEIDAAATAILDHAALQKQELSQDMEKRTKEFDEALQTETEETLNRLQKHMETSTAKALQKLEADTEARIETLKANYSQNHSQMAGEIFQRIIDSE